MLSASGPGRVVGCIILICETCDEQGEGGTRTRRGASSLMARRSWLVARRALACSANMGPDGTTQTEASCRIIIQSGRGREAACVERVNNVPPGVSRCRLAEEYAHKEK